jgi:cation transport protein ChaC
MSHDTIAANRHRHDFSGRDSVWLFGYGSLIYKADFPFLERRPARIRGWLRRFWQGSHDHRGTPDAPGRVTTLVPEPGAMCAGMAYRVEPKVFDHLDVREKNGYLRFTTPLDFGGGESAEGLVYIATEDNAAYLGHAPEDAIARHVAASQGPSGSNRDYVLRLAEALRAMGENDPHVFAIERHLRQLERADTPASTGH